MTPTDTNPADPAKPPITDADRGGGGRDGGDPWWVMPAALLVLAGPIIATMVSRTAMSFVDFVMVSQLGTDAQAAIMPANILLFCIISFGMGLTSVVTTFVSQALGREAHGECAAYLWQGIYLSLAIGAAGLAALPVVKPLFAAVGHTPTVQVMEVSYVRIGLLGLAPTLVAAAVGDFFSGIHKPAIGFWAMLVSNLFNVFVNWVLIFGHLGFPAMGITGAALATLIAAVLQVAILMAWMLRPALHRQFETRYHTAPSWVRTKRIIRIGFPAAAQFTLEIAAFTVFTLLLVGRFGTVQLAAHNLVLNCLDLAFMPTIGLGMATSTMVGKAIGRRDPRAARSVVRWATVIAMAYMGTIALIYVLGGRGLAGLLSDDPDVVTWAHRLLLLCAAYQVFDAVGITHSFALRGAGDTRWPAIVGTSLVTCILIGGGWGMAHAVPGWGILGPWAAAVTYIIAVAIMYWLRWTTGPWERIDIEQ